MANALQIILSFKPVLDGLNKFASAVQQRMDGVRALNQKLAEGANAVNQLMAQAAAVVGVAAMKRYVDMAEAEGAAQKQLAAALAQTGQYSKGWLEDLTEQADALERVTKFTNEDIMGAQRALASYGVRGEALKELTKVTLDFAAAQGMDAKSAADLVAKTIASPVNALTRYGVTIDVTKDKTAELVKSLNTLFGGQARAAVVFPELHEAGVEIEDIEKSLGRLGNSGASGVILAFVRGISTGVQAIKDFVTWLRSLLPSGLSAADAIEKLAGKIGAAIPFVVALMVPLLAFKALMATLPLIIGPARSAFMLFFGEDFVAAIANVQAFTKELGFLQTMSLANLGQKFATFGAIAAAAFAGWQIGKFINDLEISGVKIKDWVAVGIVWIGEKLGDVWDGLRAAWVVIKAASDALWDSLQLATAEGVKLIIQGLIALGEAWNALPFHKSVNLDGLRDDLAQVKAFVDAEKAAIKGAGTAALAELDKISAEQTKRHKDAADLRKYIVDTSRAPATKAAIEPRNNPNPIAPGAAEQEKLQRNFELETQLLQAKNAGNQAEVDRIAILIEQNKLEHDLAQLDATKRTPLIKARIAAETQALTAQRTRTQQELTYSQQLGALEIKRANVEAGLYTTTEQKQRLILPLLAEENRLITQRIALLEQELAAGATDERRGQIQQQLDQLRQKQAENARASTAAQPQTIGQGAMQGLSGQGGFLDSIGTMAQNAAAAVNGTLNSALQGTAGLIENLWTRTKSWGDAWRGMLVGVGQQFSQMAAQMVAKLLWKYAIESALTKLGIIEHVAGEKVKTGATLSGSLIRIGATIKEALASVYHGAVEAFEALAKIPYVGPFLGAAAMAAALAGGIALVSKIGHADGGLITGPGGPRDDRVPAMLSNGEFVARGTAVDKFGVPFFQRLNSGILDLAALPSNVTQGIATPITAAAGAANLNGATASGARQPNVTVINVQSEREATRIARRSRAAGDVVQIVRDNWGAITKRGPV